jgi:hypothetical protein
VSAFIDNFALAKEKIRVTKYQYFSPSSSCFCSYDFIQFLIICFKETEK